MVTLTRSDVAKLVDAAHLVTRFDEHGQRGESSLVAKRLRRDFEKTIEEGDDVVAHSLRSDKGVLTPIVEQIQNYEKDAADHRQQILEGEERARSLHDKVAELEARIQDLEEERDELIKSSRDIVQFLTEEKMVDFAAQLEKSLRSSESEAAEAKLYGFSPKGIWRSLRAQVHDLLCTNSVKYKKERALFQQTTAPAITALAAIVTHKYSVPKETAAAFAGLALTLPLKMAREAWCAAYVEEEKLEKLEAAELRKMSQKANSKDQY